MFELNLPAYDHKIRTVNGKNEIFDFLRHKFVALTPEEWVRQHFAHYLIEEKGYPAGRTVLEASIPYNGRKKRCDAVIYDASLQPLVLVELKAPDVAITQKVFDQIAAYNFALHVNYLIVSNGMNHFCCKMDYEKHRVVFIPNIPTYAEL
ncbi:MAG TPA: type I restriction enzyme HsdR N-terminal domain-containing protein [Bacteroidales bacterium]|nr:type I restriction enzyme HsdR N-terminal domain-containing protein [Bacteroidales bacterium]